MKIVKIICRLGLRIMHYDEHNYYVWMQLVKPLSCAYTTQVHYSYHRHVICSRGNLYSAAEVTEQTTIYRTVQFITVQYSMSQHSTLQHVRRSTYPHLVLPLSCHYCSRTCTSRHQPEVYPACQSRTALCTGHRDRVGTIQGAC
jgi:hypothetical protein